MHVCGNLETYESNDSRRSVLCGLLYLVSYQDCTLLKAQLQQMQMQMQMQMQTHDKCVILDNAA